MLQIMIIIIAELAEHILIIIQNSSNPFKPKNLDVQLYDRMTLRLYNRMTIQGATFNMLGQLYRGTPMPWLCPVVQWSVHWAPRQTTRVLVLARARRCASSTLRLG